MEEGRQDKIERREERQDKKREEARQKKRKTLKPADELAQNVSKKILSDELFLHFFSKVQNLTVFSIIYMIRIRFFGPGE